MSDEWKVGDLAVFIGPRDPDDEDRGMVIGRVYTVSAYFIGLQSALPCLLFKEGIDPSPWSGWRAECFRKIRPDEHEDCEPEFVTLLESFKPVPADLAREELR